ncbi:MAG: enoyl-CoA hydratase/isomerase family protein [Rhodobacteraceae bacterium]|nr:enoyl-CoA hydratase/isomerase family protein [Paracoccaceae bacterium]
MTSAGNRQTSPHLVIARAKGVLEITLNRPEAANALSRSMLEGLQAALDEAGSDDAVRAVLLSAEGQIFMAGGDLEVLEDIAAAARSGAPEPGRQEVEAANALTRTILALPKPVIAAVSGDAAGFGMSLVLAADYALMAREARLHIAYTRLGATCDGGMSHLLVRRLGPRAAFATVLEGRVDADRAHALGLVHALAPGADLRAQARAFAEAAARGPTRALGAFKALLQEAALNPLEDQFEAEAQAFARTAAMADFAEGVAAVRERRPARFNGR